MTMRLLCAVLSGLLLAAAFPLSIAELPLGSWGMAALGIPGFIPDAGYGQVAWFALIALVPLMEAARGSRSDLEACGWGYLAGVIWLSLHWLWLGSFGWLPVVLIAAFYGLPYGLVGLLFRRLILTGRLGYIVWGVPAIWVAVEYLRSFSFWAFPWNLLGYTQVRNLDMIQVADLGGVYLVSFLLVLANAVLWVLLTPLERLRPRLGYVLMTAGLVLLALAYGEFRQGSDYNSLKRLPLELALVQGGMETRQRWSEDRLTRALDAYIPPSQKALSDWDAELDRRKDTLQPLTGPRRVGELLVVWPEGALPRSMDQRRPDSIPYVVRSLLDDHQGCALLLGAIGRPVSDELAHNGCLLVESGEVFSWPYSKTRLVAYGEVVPLREVARFLDYPWGSYDLNAGRSLEPLSWRGHQLALIICFDNIFSFAVRRQVSAGAGGIILMTNNSWYTLTSGIRQHCDIDVLRAVEYRRPLARVSTTGWSHLVAPSGRVVEETSLNGADLLEVSMWPADVRTFYLQFGDVFAQICSLCALFLACSSIFAGRSEGIL